MPIPLLIGALLSHYRRHPVQALFLVVGIVVANALLAGTLLINAQARASYETGEQYLSATPSGQLRHRDRNRGIDERDYIRLRRQGFDMLAPLQRTIVRTAAGEPLEVLGIDIFAMPRSAANRDPLANQGPAAPNFMAFTQAPFQLWAGKARLDQLGLAEGDRITLSSGQQLPPLSVVTGAQLGHRMLMDIGALQSVTGGDAELSSMLVFPAPGRRLEALRASLPDHLEYIAAGDMPDPAELTRSFHLNLAAMGLLAFVVGIFLIYNALAFSYTDRRELIRKLRIAGATRGELTGSLLLELLLFLATGMLAGSWLGAQLSAVLLPGVGRTLAQLYGVYIAYPDGLSPSGFLLPVLMTTAAAGLCALFPLRESLTAPMLERMQARWQDRAVSRRDRLMSLCGLSLLGLSALAWIHASTLWLALTGMACLLLGAALLLPAVLRGLLAAMAKKVRPQHARLSWLLADSRWLLGPASLALMAMTLALVANSGLNTMISSFRQATDQWLEQRLAADIYLRESEGTTGVQAWLDSELPGLHTSERYQKRITGSSASGEPVAMQIVSLRDGAPFRDSVELLGAAAGARDKFNGGKGVYISERAWRIDGWRPGDTIRLCPNRGVLPVLGVDRVYGNPRSQWMISKQLFLECWPQEASSGLSIYGPAGTDWNGVRAALTGRFGLRDGDVISQVELKQAGLAAFDRTFTVTQALNALTLLVAGIGIFCAISAIHHHRVGQQALLSSLGMTRRERGVLLLLQWSVLGLLCMVLVWPFGALLAAYLANVVTPAAFGWSFPLRLEWGHYLVLAGLAAGSMTMAVLLPSLKLLRISPGALLREQSV
jgi:putative ABC transport system permease protein